MHACPPGTFLNE